MNKTTRVRDRPGVERKITDEQAGGSRRATVSVRATRLVVVSFPATGTRRPGAAAARTVTTTPTAIARHTGAILLADREPEKANPNPNTGRFRKFWRERGDKIATMLNQR